MIKFWYTITSSLWTKVVKKDNFSILTILALCALVLVHRLCCIVWSYSSVVCLCFSDRAPFFSFNCQINSITLNDLSGGRQTHMTVEITFSKWYCYLFIVLCRFDSLCLLTVNGICLFWQLNGIWGVVPPPPKNSGTTKGMTMKFLPDVGIHKEARNQKIFWHNWSGL